MDDKSDKLTQEEVPVMRMGELEDKEKPGVDFSDEVKHTERNDYCYSYRR